MAGHTGLGGIVQHSVPTGAMHVITPSSPLLCGPHLARPRGHRRPARADGRRSGHPVRAYGSTKFLGLRVGGEVVADATPDKNSEIDLAGVGKVILNQQSTSDAFDNYTQSVTGLRLIVDTGTSALPTGQAVIAYAVASLHSPKFARAYGNAYPTYVQIGDVVRSGPTALVDLPCGGTSGKTRTSAGTTIAGLEINGDPVTVTGNANQRIGIAGVGNLYIRRSRLSDTDSRCQPR